MRLMMQCANFLHFRKESKHFFAWSKASNTAAREVFESRSRLAVRVHGCETSLDGPRRWESTSARLRRDQVGTGTCAGMSQQQESAVDFCPKNNQPHDPAYTFRGYELDALRQPTFRYEFKGVTVTESFAPDGDEKSGSSSIKRIVKIE